MYWSLQAKSLEKGKSATVRWRTSISKMMAYECISTRQFHSSPGLVAHWRLHVSNLINIREIRPPAILLLDSFFVSTASRFIDWEACLGSEEVGTHRTRPTNVDTSVSGDLDLNSPSILELLRAAGRGG